MQIDFDVFFTGALLILLLPLDWLTAALIASVFHELCHIFALFALHGKIKTINIKTDTCIIETSGLGDWSQFLSILAGPCGSFFLLVLCHAAPKVAACGFLQGLYNMLPVLPLDGGRLLRLLLYRFIPKWTETLMYYIAVGTCILFVILSAWFSMVSSAGFLLLLFAVIWSIKVLPRKFPCKQPEIGLQ